MFSQTSSPVGRRVLIKDPSGFALMADTDGVHISAVILDWGPSLLIQQWAEHASATSECWMAGLLDDWPRKEATGNNLDSVCTYWSLVQTEGKTISTWTKTQVLPNLKTYNQHGRKCQWFHGVFSCHNSNLVLPITDEKLIYVEFCLVQQH